ncbi:MAG: efflux RND transporter periplasmic adaptor subunit [Acidobacteriota bacterium]
MKIHRFPLWRGASHRSLASGVCAIALASATFSSSQTPDVNAVTVKVQTFTPQLAAYGQVEPLQLVPLSAAETGVVEGLRVVPGAHVRAGQPLATLGGPTMQTLLMQTQAEVRSARSALNAAQQSLAIEREQLPSHLTTRQAIQQAESAAAQAQTVYDSAQSKLSSVLQLMTLAAPVSGIVIATNSANGQLVSAGQPVVTLQPAAGLWLRANYYGSDLNSIHPGMTGTFMPSDGGAPIRVRICSISGNLAAGGGESVFLCSVRNSSAWINGEAGEVTIDLPKRNFAIVPTRALVLSQGKWWVLVHNRKGDHAQQVEPGVAQGWNTFIKSGLAPGTQVIVNNAYLLFHSNIAEQFQIPD